MPCDGRVNCVQETIIAKWFVEIACDTTSDRLRAQAIVFPSRDDNHGQAGTRGLNRVKEAERLEIRQFDVDHDTIGLATTYRMKSVTSEVKCGSFNIC